MSTGACDHALPYIYIPLLKKKKKKKTPHRELLNMVIKSSYQEDINDRQRQSKGVIKSLAEDDMSVW